MTLSLQGIGTSLPPRVLPQKTAAELAQALCCADDREARTLSALYRLAGIDTRHVVLTDQPGVEEGRANFYQPREGSPQGPTTSERMLRYAREAGTFALEASRRALESASIQPGAVTHLVIVSCTGFSAPGVDLALINGLGLGRGVRRVMVGFMGCHGAMNGLLVADAIATGDPSAVVLLCAVELCSLHFQYGLDPNQVTANALFADGAAAIVGTRGAPSSLHPTVISSASNIFPDTESLMTWKIGDHGFEMYLSPAVPSVIAAHLRPWLTEWLALHARTIEDIGSWAIHPGGPRILTSVQEALALPAAALAHSRAVLRECGNLSSPTTLHILERILGEEARMPCVMLGFGPGLAAEAILIDRK